MNRDTASIVAIVDDDEEVRDVLRVLLETAGHAVETFGSGADFLTRAQLDQIGCLVVDQHMPEMTGVDLISTVARRGMTIPALLITGAPDPEISRSAEELGAMTVLEKPMSSQELLRFVEFSLG